MRPPAHLHCNPLGPHCNPIEGGIHFLTSSRKISLLFHIWTKQRYSYYTNWSSNLITRKKWVSVTKAESFMLHQDVRSTPHYRVVALRDTKAAPICTTLLDWSQQDQDEAGIFTKKGVTFWFPSSTVFIIVLLVWFVLCSVAWALGKEETVKLLLSVSHADLHIHHPQPNQKMTSMSLSCGFGHLSSTWCFWVPH